MIYNILTKFKRLAKPRSSKPLSSLHTLLGFYPVEYKYYKAAFTHNSCAYRSRDGRLINNERLEFLGDSVLATAISSYLYKIYPDWSEGQMSKRRGTIVKRAVNNAVAEKMNIGYFIKKRDDISTNNDILGNTLEALIGAIYLDRGYDKAQEFILEKVIPIFKSIEKDIADITTNYKSTLIEWAQKKHLELTFKMIREPKKSYCEFVCELWLDNKFICKGKGFTKKESHQSAASSAINILKNSYKDLSIPKI